MSSTYDNSPTRLRRAIVTRVREDTCEVALGGGLLSVRYANQFPSPRIERVSPGHLVAIATSAAGAAAVVWRWYDAVIIGAQDDLVQLWEPSHGEVLARPRRTLPLLPGTRAYLSAGLPGAEWWVAGPAAATAQDAEVELHEVERLYTENNLWDDV